MFDDVWVCSLLMAENKADSAQFSPSMVIELHKKSACVSASGDCEGIDSFASIDFSLLETKTCCSHIQ